LWDSGVDGKPFGDSNAKLDTLPGNWTESSNKPPYANVEEFLNNDLLILWLILSKALLKPRKHAV